MASRRDRRLTRGERNAAWIESHCRVPEGRLVGKPVTLTKEQRGWLKTIYDTPTRRFILSMGRKNGKTAFSAFLLLLHLVGPEARENSQLFSAAQSREQAAVLFNLAAMRGSVEAKVYRKELSQEMESEDVAEAQRQAREWLAHG